MKIETPTAYVDIESFTLDPNDDGYDERCDDLKCMLEDGVVRAERLRESDEPISDLYWYRFYGTITALTKIVKIYDLELINVKMIFV